MLCYFDTFGLYPAPGVWLEGMVRDMKFFTNGAAVDVELGENMILPDISVNLGLVTFYIIV